MSNFVITASVDDQDQVTVTGSGFPPAKLITIRATNLTTGQILNTWAQATSDSDGNFTYQQQPFCAGLPLLWKIDATDGSPDPDAGFNYNWSNEADIQCVAKPTSTSTPPTGTPSSSPSGSSSSPTSSPSSSS